VNNIGYYAAQNLLPDYSMMAFFGNAETPGAAAAGMVKSGDNT
jgi:hypothetical protein